MRVYLSGSIKEVEYREYVKNRYSTVLDIRDPLEEVENRLIDPEELKILKKLGFSTARKEIINKIVEGDMLLLSRCDCLVAMMNIYSAGTIMEIRVAYCEDMPVYVIDPSLKFREDVWIKYHTNVFFDLIDDCFKFLLEKEVK